MLERLEAGSFASGLRRRREPRASHSARLLQTELELALRRPRRDGARRGSRARPLSDVDRLTRLANDLLVLAPQIDGAPRSSAVAHAASQVLDRVARRFATRAASPG